MSLTSSNVSVSVTTRVMTVTDLLTARPFKPITAVHYLLSLRKLLQNCGRIYKILHDSARFCKILRDFVRIYVFKKGLLVKYHVWYILGKCESLLEN